jgi:hypothetical protein
VSTIIHILKCKSTICTLCRSSPTSLPRLEPQLQKNNVDQRWRRSLISGQFGRCPSRSLGYDNASAPNLLDITVGRAMTAIDMNQGHYAWMVAVGKGDRNHPMRKALEPSTTGRGPVTRRADHGIDRWRDERRTAPRRVRQTSGRELGSANLVDTLYRFERYMQSDAPDFEPKAADVIGLYVNPPDHAAVFCGR